MKPNSLEKTKIYYEWDDVTFKKMAPHTVGLLEEQVTAFREAFKKAKSKIMRRRRAAAKKRELFEALNDQQQVIDDSVNKLGNLF